MNEFNPVILIPFYNHFIQFKDFLPNILIYKIQILVIDDGSENDESQNIKNLCDENKVFYFRIDKNSGKGGAVLTGFKIAKEKGFSHVLQIDADGQHDAKDIEKFLKISKENQDAIINGVPVCDSSQPLVRKFGHKVANFWIMLETHSFAIKDAMCGFRVYPLKHIEAFSKVCFLRMGFDIEIMVKAYWQKILIINVDTKVSYVGKQISHFNVIKDNFKLCCLHAYLCVMGVLKSFSRFCRR